MSTSTAPELVQRTGRARGLVLASVAAVVLSATLLFLNYRYVSATVNLDDVTNPYLAWAPWSRLALFTGGLLGPTSMVFAIAAATRKDAGVASRIAGPVLLLASLAVLYARYKIRI